MRKDKKGKIPRSSRAVGVTLGDSGIRDPSWPPQAPVAAQPAVVVDTVSQPYGHASAHDHASARDQPQAYLGSITADSTRSLNRLDTFPIASWDRYEFVRVLGHGGMGSVYLARDRRLGRAVAIKFVAGRSDRMRLRFMQEARAQSRIDHPGVCKVYEVGEVEGKTYIAMQFIDGRTLDQAKSSLSPREKVEVIRDTARALHFAHELGIIHRDVKPGNIMLENAPEGGLHPVLMDFGLARDAHDGSGITESGMVMGTAAYMSPEQARGDVRNLDRRSDVYSLGMTLFDLIAGRPPFQSEQLLPTLLGDSASIVPALSTFVQDVPPALEVIVGKCLNREPDQRYATARDLADDLDRYLRNQRIVAKKVSLTYRAGYFARKNRLLVTFGVGLVASLLILSGYGIRNRIAAQKREQFAQEQADLARRLGQSVEQLEWLTRAAYTMPLHDTGYEMALVRSRMTEIAADTRSHGLIGAGPGDYALGRGYLALHEWRPALEFLRKAQASGLADLELDYALGRVLGELYSAGLAEARSTGDSSFVARRQRELHAQYLVPALAHLERSRALKTVSATYVQGLIDFYLGHDDAALLHAHLAQRQTPWLYEAAKLEGDVYLARALRHKEHGEHAAGTQNFGHARRSYEKANEQGRSDAQIYEAIAETWIRQMEMDELRGVDPRPQLAAAVNAAEQAREASPTQSNGPTKKAFAYLFVAQYLALHGQPAEFVAMTERLIAAGEEAVRRHPEDIYARDALANGYLFRAKQEAQNPSQFGPLLTQARTQLLAATAANHRFQWAYNDLGRTYLFEAEAQLYRHEDPMSNLASAIQAFNKATEVDNDYLFGHSNSATAYAYMIQHELDHGIDPSVHYADLTAAAQNALRINGQDLLTHGALIQGSILLAIYHLDSGRDLDGPIQAARQHIGKFIQLQPGIPIVYNHLAITHQLIAQRALRQGDDPSAAIQSGLRALADGARRSGGGDGVAASLEAQLLALQAQAQQGRNQSPQPSLDLALVRSQQAVQRSPEDPEVLLAAAEATWRAGAVRMARHMPVTQEISAGLSLIDRVLATTATWPRALAVKGALLTLQARSTDRGGNRAELVARAGSLLSLAADGNALLRNAYPEAYRDWTALRASTAPAPLGTGSALAERGGHVNGRRAHRRLSP